MGGVLGTIIAIVLAVAFLAAGVAKLQGVPQMKQNLSRLGVRRPLPTAIGALEVLAAVGLLLGFFATWIAVLAALGLTMLMIGAVVFHVRAGDGPAGFGAPALLGVLALVLFVILL